jgi:hypothetical protein
MNGRHHIREVVSSTVEEVPGSDLCHTGKISSEEFKGFHKCAVLPCLLGTAHLTGQ